MATAAQNRRYRSRQPSEAPTASAIASTAKVSPLLGGVGDRASAIFCISLVFP
ncbi:MAG: hypothetical protein AAFX01_09115 [Cyanobacteria bacterium J06638_28]